MFCLFLMHTFFGDHPNRLENKLDYEMVRQRKNRARHTNLVSLFALTFLSLPSHL